MKVSEKIPMEELHVSGIAPNVKIKETPVGSNFKSLHEFVSQYNSKDAGFNLANFETKWHLFATKENQTKWNDAELKNWIEITGLLQELTNNTEYVEELENVLLKTGTRFEPNIVPFVFTKRVDHIYVNLFRPLEINYKHSLGGDVKFSQECNYPKSGTVKMHFSMTERRYIELYIRIPSWAEGTTVTVKKVKYFTSPGSYCLIAKKWKEGDLVEVEFPIDKMPSNGNSL
uniref:hypothetical protein n=1 Tax=uncultured Draconibacterium sp. TaxID=1573823 RepID=UPI003216D249